MSIFDSIKSVLVTKPISIPIKQDTLNAAIGKSISNENDIEAIAVTLHEGWIETHSKIRSGVGALNVAANFEIQSFVINKNTQTIELRIKDKPEINAENRFTNIALSVVDGLISVLFGTSLLARKLNAKDGVQVNGSVISIDLAKLGVLDLLQELAKNRGGVIVERLLSVGISSLSDRLCVQGINCNEGQLSVIMKIE